MMLKSLMLAGALLGSAGPAAAAPGYAQTRAELEQVLNDLIAWLPGTWDSFPQVYAERHGATPPEGEHEHWARTFARIDAPQIGPVVFYGQVNVGGRDGPILAGSQVLYKAEIDERLGGVNVLGQGPTDPEKYENLQDRPELWGTVRMRDPGALNCDFIWRRDGAQIFGVLRGNTPEKQKYGPGTCAFMSARSGAEFRADAEWVLGPDVFWLYDANWTADQLFQGRNDGLHMKLSRATPYVCSVKDAAGKLTIAAHDRGWTAKAHTRSGRELTVMLLRAETAPAGGRGLVDGLRLIAADDDGNEQASRAAAPRADKIKLEIDGVTAACAREDKFPPMRLEVATKR